jgi:hypothetical protein
MTVQTQVPVFNTRAVLPAVASTMRLLPVSAVRNARWVYCRALRAVQTQAVCPSTLAAPHAVTSAMRLLSRNQEQRGVRCGPEIATLRVLTSAIGELRFPPDKDVRPPGSDRLAGEGGGGTGQHPSISSIYRKSDLYLGSSVPCHSQPREGGYHCTRKYVRHLFVTLDHVFTDLPTRSDPDTKYKVN